MFLGIIATIGFIVTNVIRHKYNWDIVKFALVTSMVLAIGFGVMLSDLAEWADTRLRKVIRGVLAIAVLWQGVYYVFFSLFAYSPESEHHFLCK